MVAEIVERFDYKNITYRVAKEFARIHSDAFRNDIIMRTFLPKNKQFGDKALPPISQYRELKYRVDLYGKMVESYARETYLETKSNPRQQIFMLKSKESGKYVAGTLFTLPKYLDLPRISMWSRCINFLRKVHYRILDTVAFFGTTNPTKDPEFLAELEWVNEHLGLNETDRKMKELEAMSPKELQDTIYPKDMSYHIHYLVVSTTCHAAGYGSKLVNGAVEQLKPFYKPPPFGGPAKVTLYSSPNAIGFYCKLGFIKGKEEFQKVNDDLTLDHIHFYKNV